MKCKISLLTSDLSYGGQKRVTVNLANEFDYRGYRTEVICINKKGDLIPDLNDSVEIKELSYNRAHYNIFELSSVIKESNPDYLITSLVYVNLLSIISSHITFKNRVKLIVTEHSSYPDLNIKYKLLLRAAGLLYRNTHNVVSVSDSAAERLSNLSGFPLQDIEIIPNPVVSERIREMKEQEPDHEWLNEDVPVVVAAGRLATEKNYSLLIRAIARVAKDIDVRLILLGEGPQRNKLENIVNKLSLDSVISMPGFVKNPYAYMNKADVFVVSSNTETFSMSLVESLACGCSPVTTACGSAPVDILRDGQYGEIVPTNDVGSMAEAIANSINNPVPSKKLNKRANDFSVRKAADQYEELIIDE